MELHHSIEINVPPTVIYDWFLHLDRHYREWHPDHRDCYWLQGDGTRTGDVLFASEFLHGALHTLRFRMTRIEPGRYMGFDLLGLPGWMIPTGYFSAEPAAQGARFSAGLVVRGGRLFRWLLPSYYRALTTHMREEGENLKRLLETG